jgi:membrane fusion protein, multidrug efflux system
MADAVEPQPVSTSATRTASQQPEVPTAGEAKGAAAKPTGPSPPAHRLRKSLLLLAILGGLGYGAYLLVPTVRTALNTISTDDAYVDGHVTFVAPRVAGQVRRVLVDDNMRVKTGSILVQLDREPYQVMLAIKQAALKAAEADLTAAHAKVRSLVAQVRASRFQLEHAIEEVNTTIANLRANVAALKSRKASLELARGNLSRAEALVKNGGISKEDFDTRLQTVKVDEAAVDQALQAIYATRVGLGLLEVPPGGKDLGDVPPDLADNFSGVRQALGQLLHSAAELGYTPASWDVTPKAALVEFLKQDPSGKLDQIYAKLIPNAPAIKQAEAKRDEARRDLAQAELNLRYCDVVSEIDGLVTRRNVNPGNNVQAGQNLMAVRSLTEIWIDANFKETQLADLRIGQRVRCEVDMYGSRREFEGRITGFTMGTGQTLSLLPPQNATGNFVKIVQRLPVRIELSDYHPDKSPLFAGLSVVPYVYYKEQPAGPSAGEFLQPLMGLPEGPSVSGATPSLHPVPESAKPTTSPDGG